MNIKNNKIIFFVFFLFVFFSITGVCFATTTSEIDTVLTETLPNIDGIVGDNDNWFVYFDTNRGSYNIVISPGSIIYYPDDGYYSFKFIDVGFKYELIDGAWSYVKEYPIGFVTWSFDITSYICASNFDIYDTSNNLVFQKAPTLSTLTGIFSTQMVKGATKEIIIILPLIIVVVVSLVGLRKGYSLLSALLHKA